MHISVKKTIITKTISEDKRISSSENNTTNSKIHTLCISQPQNKLTNAKLHDKRISLLQYTRTNAAPHKHIKKTPPITE